MLAATIPTGLGFSCMSTCFQRFPLFPSSTRNLRQWKRGHSFSTSLARLSVEPSSSSSSWFPKDNNELASVHEHPDGSFTFSFGNSVANNSEASSETVIGSVISSEDVELDDDVCLETESPSAANDKGFFFRYGIATVPQPVEAFSNGEDAFFATPTWFGVSDGRNQWSFEGNCTGNFSRELSNIYEELVSDTEIHNPKEVLSAGASLAQSSGIATCLIAHVDDNVLRVASVGNSGFLVVRKGEILRTSLSTPLEFDFHVLFGRGHDPGELVEEYDAVLEEGDVVVCGTDGLFDNMYKEEVAAIVDNSMKANWSLQETAEKISKTASALGRKRCGRSPFADAAEAAGYSCPGGKPGDVTVIVSLVLLSHHLSSL